MEFVLLGVIIALGGAGVLWWLSRNRASASVDPQIDRDVGGYGSKRWEREIAVWQGTLRRLQRQADRYEEPPAALRQQIETAERRIARARRALEDEGERAEGDESEV